jgi:hypothetical protein
MKIQVHIERLVLDGLNFTPSQRRSLVASLESELSHLIANGGLASEFANGAAVAAARAAPVNIAAPFDGARAGAHIARSVYASFGKPVAAGKKAR